MKASLHRSLIAALEAIFPKQVGVACLPISELFSSEFEEEEACIEGANALRQQEFRAGRSCARKAMGALGIPPLPVLAGEKRGPIWPSGIIGSISHTREYCAAVVAFSGELKSIGLDMEQYKRLKPHLWRLVLTEKEAAWVEGFSALERIRMAALIFSAKEAFYKYQFPLTQAWLGFQDVEIVVCLKNRSFVLTMLKDAKPQFEQGDCISGRFYFCEGYILAGIF